MIYAKEIKTIKKILKKEFKWSDAKIAGWLYTDNPLLGDVAPITMIKIGRFEKLLKFINHQIASTKPFHNPRLPETLPE
jgi:hypothetical protein